MAVFSNNCAVDIRKAQVDCSDYVNEIVAKHEKAKVRDQIIDYILEMQQDWYFDHDNDYDLAASSALQSLLNRITDKHGGKGSEYRN